MLCLGYYKPNHNKVKRNRFKKEYVVFEEKYRHLTPEECEDMFAQQAKTFKANNIYDADNYAKAFYARKTGAKFSKEMARSVRVALKKWDGRILNAKVKK